MKNLKDEVWDGVINEVYYKVSNEVFDKGLDNIWRLVSIEISNKVSNEVYNQVWDKVRKEVSNSSISLNRQSLIKTKLL